MCVGVAKSDWPVDMSVCMAGLSRYDWPVGVSVGDCLDC